MKPCIEPGCPGLAMKGSRCRTHELQWQSERNKRPERKVYNGREYRKVLDPRGMVCAIQVPGVCTYWATTVDHIIPVSQGGTNERENLRPACRECNSHRAGRLYS